MATDQPPGSATRPNRRNRRSPRRRPSRASGRPPRPGPPQAPQAAGMPGGQLTGPMPRADFGQRLGAFAIDIAILVVAELLLSVIVGGIITALANTSSRGVVAGIAALLGILLFLAYFALPIVYFGYMEGKPSGQTLGKRASGFASSTSPPPAPYRWVAPWCAISSATSCLASSSSVTCGCSGIPSSRPGTTSSRTRPSYRSPRIPSRNDRRSRSRPPSLRPRGQRRAEQARGDGSLQGRVDPNAGRSEPRLLGIRERSMLRTARGERRRMPSR
jgi:RDD family